MGIRGSWMGIRGLRDKILGSWLGMGFVFIV